MDRSVCTLQASFASGFQLGLASNARRRQTTIDETLCTPRRRRSKKGRRRRPDWTTHHGQLTLVHYAALHYRRRKSLNFDRRRSTFRRGKSEICRFPRRVDKEVCIGRVGAHPTRPVSDHTVSDTKSAMKSTTRHTGQLEDVDGTCLKYSAFSVCSYSETNFDRWSAILIRAIWPVRVPLCAHLDVKLERLCVPCVQGRGGRPRRINKRYRRCDRKCGPDKRGLHTPVKRSTRVPEIFSKCPALFNFELPVFIGKTRVWKFAL